MPAILGLLESERRARTDAEHALERLRAIQSITDSALAHLSLDELLQELLIRLRRALETDFATVLMLGDDRQALYLRAVDGYDKVPSVRVPLGEGVSGWIAKEGRPRIVDDYSTVDTCAYEGVSASYLRRQVSSVMGAPLRVGDEVIGVVLVCSRRSRGFTDADLELLLLVADRAAPAVERARLLETIDKGRHDLENLSRRLLAAQEEERRRVAVELHDELGQILTAIRINLDSKRQSLTRADLADAIDSVDQAMDRVRNLALALRPSVLDDLGLAAALRWYLDRFARETGADAHISIDVVARIDPVVEITCFRIAQESLTNVARHAHARHVWFDLSLVGDQLELRVRDDGKGFDPAAVRARTLHGGSLGLLGIQERASLAGGRVEISSVPGTGTEVRAWFPATIGAGEPA